MHCTGFCAHLGQSAFSLTTPVQLPALRWKQISYQQLLVRPFFYLLIIHAHLLIIFHVCVALTVILLALLRAATQSLMSVTSLAWRKYRRETALMTALEDSFYEKH